MSTALFLLLITLALLLLWLDGARARELAVGVVDELCRRRGFQLLDQTVALSRLGLARTDRGLRLKRLFSFDYSIEGVGRRQGFILLHGSQAVWLDIAEGEQEEEASRPAEASPAGQGGSDAKVIPFRRR